MKINRIDNRFFDESNQQITWHFIHEHTGLGRGESRILLKKLAASGADVAPNQLLKWRDDQVLIWKLEHELGVRAA